MAEASIYMGKLTKLYIVSYFARILSIPQFWRLLKSVFRLKTIQLRGDGLYAGLLFKVSAYLMVLRLRSQKAFRNLSVVQTLRQIRREGDLDNLINQHFHGLIGGT